jgi:hypothetical protein
MIIDGKILLNVKWDTTSDEYPEGEPEVKTEQVIGVPKEIYEMDEQNNFETDYVSDYLSDEYGWLVLEWGNF